MKKYLLILFTVGLFTGCSKYDDGELWDSVNDLEARLSTLETMQGNEHEHRIHEGYSGCVTK